MCLLTLDGTQIYISSLPASVFLYITMTLSGPFEEIYPIDIVLQG